MTPAAGAETFPQRADAAGWHAAVLAPVGEELPVEWSLLQPANATATAVAQAARATRV
jgi:hypothetical protein